MAVNARGSTPHLELDLHRALILATCHEGMTPEQQRSALKAIRSHPREVARVLFLLMLIMGAAPILAPTLGFVTPNAAALAQENHGARAGVVASAVLGSLQFGLRSPVGTPEPPVVCLQQPPTNRQTGPLYPERAGGKITLGTEEPISWRKRADLASPRSAAIRMKSRPSGWTERGWAR